MLARRFGSVFVLALAQRAEARSPYEDDATPRAAMAADERIHEEVVRGLAARGRDRLSGTFRAAVFGANDGLVSNLALVLGVGASGVSTGIVLLTGLAGLLAGALSMGAGEYVSVRSQRELLDASTPGPGSAARRCPHLDVDANELALRLPRARHGASSEAADARRRGRSARRDCRRARRGPAPGDALADRPSTSTRRSAPACGAALSSFCFFASGALMPVLPYLFGLRASRRSLVAAVLVGLALLATGAIVGLLSGASPLQRALRQLAIGFGAAAVTYLLGLLFGTGAI